MAKDFKPDEPWSFVDWDRLQDALAGLIKNTEQDKKDKKEVEERVLMYSDLIDLMNKEIKQLKLELMWKERE